MTIQQLRYILGIAENGSFNKAAEKLFVSQPSLTASIRDSENELGFKIFCRSSRGITVTERGKNFIKDAIPVYEEFNKLIIKHSQTERKVFSVSALYYSFARKAFVEVVKKFSNENYEFSFHEVVASTVIDEVSSGKSSLGIIYLSDSNKNQILENLDERNLSFQHLSECSALVYLHKNHPLSKKKYITLEELSKFQFVTFDTDDLKSFFSKNIIETYNLKNPITVSDRSTELNLLKNLNGYTFLSGISGEDTNDDFITIPLQELGDNNTASFQLGYITKKDAHLNTISLAYIDSIQQILQKQKS